LLPHDRKIQGKPGEGYRPAPTHEGDRRGASFGYRRLHVLLKREGYLVNHKKLFRLYREERLAVRRRGGGRAAAHRRWRLRQASRARETAKSAGAVIAT
jgi:hypothetical protein